MHRLRQLAARCTGPKVVLFAALLAVAMFFINGDWIGVGKLLEITGGINILDFDFGYSAAAAYEQIAAMGSAGRAYYLTRIIPMDFLFPACYALLYAVVIGWGLNKLAPKRDAHYLLMVLPAFAMSMDWLENLCMILLLIRYPTQITAVATAASISTVSKFLSISSCWAIMAVLLLVTGSRSIRRRP